MTINLSNGESQCSTHAATQFVNMFVCWMRFVRFGANSDFVARVHACPNNSFDWIIRNIPCSIKVNCLAISKWGMTWTIRKVMLKPLNLFNSNLNEVKSVMPGGNSGSGAALFRLIVFVALSFMSSICPFAIVFKRPSCYSKYNIPLPVGVWLACPRRLENLYTIWFRQILQFWLLIHDRP